MALKYLTILAISFFLCSCSDFDKAKKFEKTGNNAGAAELFDKFLSGQPTDSQKIKEASFFLGKYNMDKNCKRAAIYFADSQKAGLEPQKIEEEITNHADSFIQNKDFAEVLKLAECFSGINENTEKYFSKMLMEIKNEEQKAIDLVAEAKNKAEKKNLAAARSLLDNAISIAPKSPAVTNSIPGIEEIIAEFQGEYDYNLNSKGISHVFDCRYKSCPDSLFEEELVMALQKTISGDNEFERKRDAEKVEKRYSDALGKKIVVKYFASFPEYDFEAKQYKLLTRAPENADFAFIPKYIEFPNIKIEATQAEKIKKLNNAGYYVEVITQPDHLRTKEEIKADLKDALSDESAAEFFASQHAGVPSIAYKVLDAKCVIKGVGTLYMSR